MAVPIADWPYELVTVKDRVEDPVCPLAMARCAVHTNVVEPQPGVIEMPDAGSRVVLLLCAVMVNGPAPDTVNATGLAVAGSVTD